MKKLLLIALVAGGLAFIPAQRSDAQISIGIGYPGYGYGYYPYGYYRPYSYYYGYYRPYSYYRYYYGPEFNWYHGHRVYYRHHHHQQHYYHRYWGTRTNNETLAAAVMRVSNPDWSPLRIHD